MTDARRLDRRDFVRLGLVGGPAALLAACGWDGGSSIEPRLRAISRFNENVTRSQLFSRFLKNVRLGKASDISEPFGITLFCAGAEGLVSRVG